MPMCCGKNRRGRFCNVCGGELGKGSDALDELLAYLRTTIKMQQTTHDSYEVLASKSTPSTKDNWQKRVARKARVIERWQRWERALSEVINNRAEDQPAFELKNEPAKPKPWTTTG